MDPNLGLVINIVSLSYLENEITLSKKTFVNVHSADNIRDDYLIGKVLGSGKFYLLCRCSLLSFNFVVTTVKHYI